MTPSAYTRIVFGSALLAAAVISLQPVHAAPAATAAAAPVVQDGTACPPTPKLEARDPSDDGSPILGCWNHVNLGVMAEQPSDLARGRPLGPDDGTRAATAVEAYRKGLVKLPPSGGASAGIVLQGIQTSGGQ